MPDWSTWTPYMQSALALTAGWLVKSQIQTQKDVVQLQTTIEFYIERQTMDAARRLDVNNPVPPEIQALVRKHVQREELSESEKLALTSWLRWTGRGENPKADPAERSAALQLLTGIRTKERFGEPRKWWRWII